MEFIRWEKESCEIKVQDCAACTLICTNLHFAQSAKCNTPCGVARCTLGEVHRIHYHRTTRDNWVRRNLGVIGEPGIRNLLTVRLHRGNATRVAFPRADEKTDDSHRSRARSGCRVGCRG